MDQQTKREYAKLSMAIKRKKAQGLAYRELLTLRNNLLKNNEKKRNKIEQKRTAKKVASSLEMLRDKLLLKAINQIDQKDQQTNVILTILNNILRKQEQLESLLTSYQQKESALKESLQSLLAQIKINNNQQLLQEQMLEKILEKVLIKKQEQQTENNQKTEKPLSKKKESTGEKKTERIRSRQFDQDLITRVEKSKGPGAFPNAIIKALDYYKEQNLHAESFPTYQLKERTKKSKDFKVYPRTRKIFLNIRAEKRFDVLNQLIRQTYPEKE